MGPVHPHSGAGAAASAQAATMTATDRVQQGQDPSTVFAAGAAAAGGEPVYETQVLRVDGALLEPWQDVPRLLAASRPAHTNGHASGPAAAAPNGAHLAPDQGPVGAPAAVSGTAAAADDSAQHASTSIAPAQPLPHGPAELWEGLSALWQAVALLSAGQCVAMPTETVYGLAANATDADAVGRIYAAKRRPADNPLIVHVSSLEMLGALYPPGWGVPEAYRAVLGALWPGPLTVLLPRR